MRVSGGGIAGLFPALSSFSPGQSPDVAAGTMSGLDVTWKHFPKPSGTLTSALTFILGCVSGCVGATVVYPIDLVKTRMQNQSKARGAILHTSSLNCARNVIKGEGFLGLYSGLGTQLLGVAPEKAIKLTTNDFVLSLARHKPGEDVEMKYKVLSGCAAGASQVLFTNPLEIVKIQLQVQGDLVKLNNNSKGVTAWSVTKQLGFFGLYKGSLACLMRDVPFSAIYFPLYDYIKRATHKDLSKPIQPHELLISGCLSGIPAAFLVTPADVIKTRLQVSARTLDMEYTSIAQTARKIYLNEGVSAFFKGSVARVFRSSPQFGITLCTFDLLKQYLLEV